MAEEHKKSFMLYFDNFPCVAALDAEQRGELLLLLYRYAMAADKAPTDPEEVLRQHPGLREETRMAYRFLAETIRRDTEKWKEKQRRYQEAAARLHVTDKAVSKWERGLSYPDVTLLEPLAAALDLTVEELMACRRQAAKGAEETMQSLLDISRDSVRQERRRSWQRLAAVLVLLAVTAAVVAYTQIVVTEEGYYSIVLKETVNGRNCVYVEDRGHLIRLKCGEDVDFDALTLRDERGDTISYQMDFQWNRLTRTGTVSACEDTGVTVLGGVMDVTYEGDSGSVPLLFGDTSVQYLRDGYYPDPYAESENLVFLCDVRFWPYHPEEPDPTGINTRAILEVEDCINAEALDVDGDGELEVAVRTRWPEKPYTVYDYVDGEIVESWPDTLPEEILEQMWASWEGL